jgi:hypothetical protein
MPSAPPTLRQMLMLMLGSAVVLAADDCLLPVHKAAEKGDADKMKRILAKDKFAADASDLCGSAIRPLMLAAHGGHAHVVKQLLDAGASADVAHAENGVTPLIAASLVGDLQMVEALLKTGQLDVNRGEARNWTALSFASQYGHGEVVSALLDAGADAAWATGAGLTPWMLAYDAEQKAVLDVLKARGAPGREASTLWLSGRLPLETLTEYGVPDAAALSQTILGEYSFREVTAGMTPQQLAILKALERVGKGGAGADESTSLETAAGNVGGGPMPTYSRRLAPGGAAGADGDSLLMMIAFDPQPGAQMWQLLALQQQQQQPQSGKGKGMVYLRGKPPSLTGSSSGNPLDVTSVTKWEVAVGVVQGTARGRQTEWVSAPELQVTRGELGRQRWAAAQKDEL